MKIFLNIIIFILVGIHRKALSYKTGGAWWMSGWPVQVLGCVRGGGARAALAAAGRARRGAPAAPPSHGARAPGWGVAARGWAGGAPGPMAPSAGRR